MEVFEHELNELHNAGFIHRDIKCPSQLTGLAFDNILLTSEGLRLTDVGISIEKAGRRKSLWQIPGSMGERATGIHGVFFE